MTVRTIFLTSVLFATAAAQPASDAVLSNLATAKWSHDKGDPPGSESVFLRQDAKTGGIELLVRFPAGHVIAPHWHDANERILVLEGQLTSRRGESDTMLDPGGFAYLPAREVQRLSCTSKARCTFYLAWDAKPGSHPAN
jgi:quercetin dioxygenase-like cupin family protein